MKFNICYLPEMDCYFLEKLCFLKWEIANMEFVNLKEIDNFLSKNILQLDCNYDPISWSSLINFKQYPFKREHFILVVKIRNKKDYKQFKLKYAEEFI